MNISNDRINNIYADSSHKTPLFFKDILTSDVTVEQAVKEAVANSFFNATGIYIGAISHGSMDFYSAVSVLNGTYISVFVIPYDTKMYQFVWSKGNYIGVRTI